MVAVLACIAFLMAPPPLRNAGATTRKSLLGHSVDGRPIRAVLVGDPDSNHVVLVVGCIHGNERAGEAIVRKLRRKNPSGVAVWTIRVINPDGAHAGTRQNARGVDLNRNFRRHWQANGDP